MNIHADRISKLRALMASKGWDAVIVPGSDPHQSEYPALRWKQVEWLTGFTGEAADVVVTDSHAGLWTDTRYFIQAGIQLAGTGVELHKTRVPEQVLIPEWLRMNLPPDAVVAVDSLCQSVAAVDGLSAAFELAMVPDLLSAIWPDRPQVPQTPVFRVNSGETRAEKLDWLRAEMQERGCDACLLTALDEIAWMLDVRASDIEYNPLVISYLLVLQDGAKWFVLKDEDCDDPVSDQTFEALADDGVSILPYDGIRTELASLCCERILADDSTLCAELREYLSCQALFQPSPVQLRKAVKNPTEIQGMRSVHLDDGVAMEKFLYWLEKSIMADRAVSEWDAALKLGRFRSQIEDYQGDSFETISAYGPGAALPHYSTPHTGAPMLEPHGLYLCDSGGQYLRGTTDITRTVPLGECTPEERLDYTLVLKGHIALAMSVFPVGTPGCRIDALARMPLWMHGRNFGHGTGHGVGSFLGVHEGPQDLRQNLNGTPLMEGMVVSDEPGLYREGRHGIRHENLLLVQEAGSTVFGHFLKFETLTLCHIDTSCIEPGILNREEVDWLNAYNARVYEELAPSLQPDERLWLSEKTAPIR